MSYESEYTPNPEIKKPITTNCYCCNEEITTDFENTVYFTYRHQNWFNHVRLVCDRGGNNIYLVDVGDIDDMEFANQFMRATSPTGFMDEPEFDEFYREQKGITLLQEHNLTERQENMVQYFAWLLNTSDAIGEFEG